MNRSLEKRFRDAVKDRDHWTCQYCGIGFVPGEPYVECAHIFTRGAHPELRRDMENAMALCHDCHAWFTDHPAAWWDFVEKHIGSDCLEELSAKAHGKRDRALKGGGE